MCDKYIARVSMKYGKMGIGLGDDYNKAIEKYKEIKEEYKGITCEIQFYNSVRDEVHFTKVNKEDSFEELYNKLIHTLADMSKYQIEMLRKEEKYGEVRNAMYHNLEETDLSELSTKEQAELLFKMKSELTQRRLNEEENQRNYAFFKAFRNICKEIEKYNDEKDNRLHHNQGRFGNDYYKEPLSEKKRRTKKLLLSLED